MIGLMQDAGWNLDELVRRYKRPLVSYAGSITGDYDRAQDVVQETFVEAERRRASGNAEITAKWLFTVCRNRALNICRKDRRLEFVSETILDASAGENQLPSDRLEEKEATGFLLRIVGTLPLRQQEVLQLRFQNNLSYEEISEIMNTSVSNVGVLIHTALRELRSRYTRAAAEFTSVRPTSERP
jgi:RNA polymerase sigma-70 factor (ECF subfamily)